MTRWQGTAKQACVGKRAHPNPASASRHAASLIRRGAWRGNVNTYHCKRCDMWHVGHRPGRRGRRR
jgi:hypothetical protein